MKHRRPNQLRGAVAVIAMSLLATACIDKRITVRFDSQSVGNPINPVNIGSSGEFTEIAVVSTNGGEIIGAPGISGNGSAADFPDHSTGPTAPRAVLRITNTGNLGLLNPGTRDFWFSADVNLDTTNATAGSNDNGNNVMQRGLFNETSQFKIQIDNGNPSCRLKGTVDDVFLGASSITPGEVYRIRCERIGTTVRLRVWPVNTDGSLGAAITDNTKTVDIGPLVFDRSIPLSVGGKLSNDGTIDPATDQFNGTIDNATLRIDFPEFDNPS